ncbi:XdhC family protein [Blautia liquoris]|uniref:XdhC family protein n=1 Tax=Blautia liquoris TaxID=2779518 RepID=A0A7M2RKC4_9FIRM|nr:XdhC/CoxI family protein [Blautia liquoris]QOV20444.1 XdhC family protein [Blautia liquoris]
MFIEVIKNIDKNIRTVIITVIEGKNQGYRCIVSAGECVYENTGIDGEVKNQIIEEAGAIKKTALKEYKENKVYFELLGERPRLVICGGGHVGIAIVNLAKLLGITVTVIEDRPMFANNARAAKADFVICDAFEHALEQVEGGYDTYFVIATRGHRYDKICLESVLKKNYAYVGMMGSRSRVRLLKEVLINEGVSEEKLEELHAPIGLSINSETPEEIAVSILGEIIQVKNTKRNSEGFTDEILEGLEQPGKKILATIITRKGSAPRQVGTKMLIMPDGTTVGTIGGGCVESDMMQQALRMLRSDESKSKLVRANMTNQDAEDEGMVCGGIEDIFLEILK